MWNPEHRGRMSELEINKVAAYMSPGNRFFAPFYRHTTIEAWMTQNEDTIRNRTRLSMGDVCAAFDHFQAHRDTSRPLIIAGFSQGGLAARNMLPTKASSMWAIFTAASLGYTASVWLRTSKSVHATIIVHQRNTFTRSGEQVTSILL